MRNMKPIGLTGLIVTFVVMAAIPATANCGNTKAVGNGCSGGSVAAPAPELGTGLLGALILAVGFIATRRKR